MYVLHIIYFLNTHIRTYICVFSSNSVISKYSKINPYGYSTIFTYGTVKPMKFIRNYRTVPGTVRYNGSTVPICSYFFIHETKRIVMISSIPYISYVAPIFFLSLAYHYSSSIKRRSII